MNVRRGFNAAAKPWTQFNYNTKSEINVKIIYVNIHWNYLFFIVLYTDNWKLECETDHTDDFELNISQQLSF